MNMERQSTILTVDEPVTITQTTESNDGQEIQTVILTLDKPEVIIEFN